jgi:hypothetical protein
MVGFKDFVSAQIMLAGVFVIAVGGSLMRAFKQLRDGE